jgi:hypothetical protein
VASQVRREAALAVWSEGVQEATAQEVTAAREWDRVVEVGEAEIQERAAPSVSAVMAVLKLVERYRPP